MTGVVFGLILMVAGIGLMVTGAIMEITGTRNGAIDTGFALFLIGSCILFASFTFSPKTNCKK